MPPKTFKDKEKDSVYTRMHAFAHFLTTLLSSNDFKHAPELEWFLSMGNDVFKSAKKRDKIKRAIPLPRDFYSYKGIFDLREVEYPTETISLDMGQDARLSSRTVSQIIDSNRQLEQEAADICKGITGHMRAISDSYQRLSDISNKIHENYKTKSRKFIPETMENCKELYNTLSKSFEKWSLIWKKDEGSFFKNIRMMFNFSSYEEDGLNQVYPKISKFSKLIFQLSELRNQFSLLYKDKRTQLSIKKEKAYPQMDLVKWEINQDSLTVPIQTLLQDKTLAKSYMFPKVNFTNNFQETLQLKSLKETWAYYNRQVVEQSETFFQLKIKRMRHQINEYVTRFSDLITRYSTTGNEIKQTLDQFKLV